MGSLQPLCREQILALDIATECGYYSLHGSGTWNFWPSRSRNQGHTYKAFYDTLTAFVSAHGIRQLVVEDLNVNAHFTDLRKLGQLHGVMLLVCEQYDLLPPAYVNVGALKKWSTGNGRAGKPEMIAACVHNYRFHPGDDNEADACHLFHYYCRKWRIP